LRPPATTSAPSAPPRRARISTRPKAWSAIVDPETQHTPKVFRIGRINSAGRFVVVYSSEVPIAPIPYPNSRSKGDWDGFLMDLHFGWNGNWANPDAGG
jgi:hypothetical protein